ncbi:vacuolar protein-sorting-associated protein 36-like [Adelges cooleyi]|uniref:vacuolar protein-sorting-associated protein 36-like n=1 Tax=Adelges cooleyi TaxID=133065 RepID=UPI0021805A45|nr:vacuolar protein-sorting-associated protein 36-like [Adelges cooleyi]
MKSVALIVLQLTAMSLGQRFGKIHRTPAGVQANDLAARQQAAYQQQQGQLAVAPAADPYSQAAVDQQYYYPQAKQQNNNNYLQQEQQLRLQLQQAQLQQLQQLQLQQRLPQQPPQQYQFGQQAQAPDADQQFSREYLQGLHVQQLQQLQAQQQEQQLLSAQQQRYQQKPLFQPAPGPQVYETPENNNQLSAAAAYTANPTEIQQTVPSKAAALQQTQNPLGVLYSSAADTSRFQFSGNGISYSF